MDKTDKDKIQNTIKQKRMTETSLNWCAEDILQENPNLTAREVEDVLSLIEYKHDPMYGVNWDTINMWIDEVLSEREENENR